MASPPHDLSHIDAAILAGGLGTRLRGTIGDRQKVAAVVNDRPFVAYLLDRLARAGIRSTVLCTGYQADEVAGELGTVHHPPPSPDTQAGAPGMQLVHSIEPRPLGTAGALAHALPHFAAERVLVLNGDSYCGVDLAAFVAAVSRSTETGADAAGGIVLVRQDDCAPYGRVEYDESHCIHRFIEKGSNAGPGWINAGVYLLRRDEIAEIPQGRSVSLEREMFPRWIARGLIGYPCEAPFLDIGTPERYAAAREFLNDAANRAVDPADGAAVRSR